MRKRRVFFTLCLVVGLTTTICVFWREFSIGLIVVLSSSQFHCYWSGSSSITELGKGEWDEPMLVPSRCLFFHETTCSSPPNLTPQQACAVESAATTNRNLNVFLLYLVPGKFSAKSRALVKILETYNNVYIRRIHLSTYVIDTPIEDWFSTNIWKFAENRVWLRKDLHDYIRMLTLWKFGGVALNLNSIVQTSLDELTTFVGVQNDINMDVGMFGIDTSTEFGRKFVDDCMEIIKNTNADSYQRYNITYIIAETLLKLCYRQKTKGCEQFIIYPSTKFYPVYSWSDDTDDANASKITQIMRNATTIHLPDDYNRDTKAENMAAYRVAAKQHCPKIYKFAAEDF